MTLNDASELSCIEFINSLMYLSGKADWEVRRAKRANIY
jgi:hypothetical protein